MAAAATHEDWTAPRFASAGGTASPLVARVREVLATVSGFCLAAIRPDQDLVEDLGFDENSRVDLTEIMETEFGIEIPDAEAEAWVTAGDVAAYVRDRFLKRSIP